MTDPTLTPELYGSDGLGEAKAAMDARRPSWPAHMDAQEARICDRLISQILGSGYEILVHDGEEPSTVVTADRSKIQAATAATGLTVYWIYHDKDVLVAGIYLVHGNGPDVIHEVSWHPQVPELDTLLDTWIQNAIEGED